FCRCPGPGLAAIGLEAVRDVVAGNAGQAAEEPGVIARDALLRGVANDLATGHVAAARHEVRSGLDRFEHAGDGCEVVRAVTHDRDDHFAGGDCGPRPQRAAKAALVEAGQAYGAEAPLEVRLLRRHLLSYL